MTSRKHNEAPFNAGYTDHHDAPWMYLGSPDGGDISFTGVLTGGVYTTVTRYPGERSVNAYLLGERDTVPDYYSFLAEFKEKLEICAYAPEERTIIKGERIKVYVAGLCGIIIQALGAGVRVTQKFGESGEEMELHLFYKKLADYIAERPGALLNKRTSAKGTELWTVECPDGKVRELRREELERITAYEY